MKSIFSSFVIGSILALFLSSCNDKVNCKLVPPMPEEFTDSVYRLFPLFNEMINTDVMTKRYYSNNDTIEITFKKSALTKDYGGKYLDGCYENASIKRGISYYFSDGKKLGDVCLNSQNDRNGGAVVKNNIYGVKYRDTVINSISYSSNYRIGTTYPCNGGSVDMIYNDALLLSNTSSGLYFIHLKSLGKKYLLVP